VFRKSFVLALPLALLAVLSIAPTAGSAPFARAATHAPSAASFSDAAGDSGAAADITDVGVGNDVVEGPIVFWVTLANRPDDLVGDDQLIVFLDTDLNPATGDAGAEYALAVDAESVGAFWWDGAMYAQVQPASLSARFSKADKAVRIAIHPNDIGVTTGFTFSVETFSGDAHDAAPNGPPDWAYTLASGRIGLSVLASLVGPKRPIAGKGLSALIQVVRNDISEVLTLGKIGCTLRIGTKSVRATQSRFVAGVALCSWKLPKSAKGKLVRGTISLTYGGVTAKKSFSARVR
jgi:hypothetical protein